ncbi:TetR/AcrR family transcriptional regulator [Gordonia sp. HS-NH1]|uniref:TetR/AcrR family transcriptional regulator n=1 Tax=Gordonia sp. HS-NH1 TaxID=1435068 RepID=UPI0006E14E18|nr:TetR/AcrR family transcriptional regulator [Gordonia sp. HS-NH1]
MGSEDTLKRLWVGAREGRRGPKPALSLDRIVDAAIGIADAEGLDAVSMARIGEALGCSSMALYRHVSGKEQLLTLMLDTATGALTLPPRTGRWREDLAEWTRAQIVGIVERPWYLDLPLTSAVPGPSRMRWIEAAFEILDEFDLPGDDLFEIVGLLAQYALSASRVQIEHRRASELAGGEGSGGTSYFERILTDLADPGQFPCTVAALGAPRSQPVGEDFGLQLILDGIATHVDSST